MLQLTLRTFYFHSAYEFLHSHTRICDRLLGPCFKTGGLEVLRQHLEGAVPEGLTERPSILGQPIGMSCRTKAAFIPIG